MRRGMFRVFSHANCLSFLGLFRCSFCENGISGLPNVPSLAVSVRRAPALAAVQEQAENTPASGRALVGLGYVAGPPPPRGIIILEHENTPRTGPRRAPALAVRGDRRGRARRRAAPASA